MNITGGSTDVTTYFVLRLSATGVEATGLTITNFDLQYVRTGAAPSAKVDATALAATDSAHGDNQAIEIDATDQPGLYRVDWPDAAFAAGVKQVILSVKCATCFTEHMAVDIDPPVNVTKVNGTAQTAGDLAALINTVDDLLDTEVAAITAAVITNAAGADIAADIIALKAVADTIQADTDLLDDVSGGLADIHTDIAAVKADTAAILIDTNELQTDDYPTSIAAVKADTAAILIDTAAMDPKIVGTLAAGTHNPQGGDCYPLLNTELADLIADIGANGSGLTALPWNAAWDAEVQSEVQDAIEANHLDHLLAVDYDPASKPGVATALLNELIENDGGVSRYSANALEQGPGGGATAAAIADAVWDEAIADHLGAGSTGNKLNAAASAGDPWSTALPGAYGAGTAGKIIGDNVNAPIGTVDTVVDAIKVVVDNIHDTDLPAVKTDTAAIKVKTDNLPADPADESALEAAITAATSPLSTGANLAIVAGYIDTEVAAIKAKTDLIGASVALETGGNVAAIKTVVDNLHDTDLPAVKADTAAILIDTGTTLDGRIPAALVGGRMDVYAGAMAAGVISAAAFSAGAIDGNAIAANAIDADALAADAVDEILDEVVEGAITLRQAIRLCLAGLAGKSTGGGTATLTFRDIADSKARITATVDANGNRTAIVRDAT